MVTADEVRGMKVAELKAELSKAGLPTSGLKAELCARLLEHIEGGGGGDAEPAAAADAAAAAPVEETAEATPAGAESPGRRSARRGASKSPSKAARAPPAPVLMPTPMEEEPAAAEQEALPAAAEAPAPAPAPEPVPAPVPAPAEAEAGAGAAAGEKRKEPASPARTASTTPAAAAAPGSPGKAAAAAGAAPSSSPAKKPRVEEAAQQPEAPAAETAAAPAPAPGSGEKKSRWGSAPPAPAPAAAEAEAPQAAEGQEKNENGGAGAGGEGKGEEGVGGFVVDTEPEGPWQPSKVATGRVKGKEVFLGNLAPEATEQDVRTLFAHVEGLGEILEVRVKIKPGAFRNFGFVRFASKEGADKAVRELDKRLVLQGRTLQVATTQAPSDKLRFGNVPKHWDTEKIGRSLSAQGCGQIYDIEFPPAADGATDKAAEAEGEAEEGAVPEVNSGVCIVEYDNYPAAQRAHRLANRDTVVMDGKRVTCDWDEEPLGGSGGGGGGGGGKQGGQQGGGGGDGREPLHVRNVFVGGVPIDVTEAELMQVFGPFGEVELVKLVGQNPGAKRTDIAFINFRQREAAQRAVDALGGMGAGGKPQIRGQTLDVEMAKPPRDRDGGRGGGDRDYRGGGGGGGYGGGGGGGYGGQRDRRDDWGRRDSGGRSGGYGDRGGYDSYRRDDRRGDDRYGGSSSSSYAGGRSSYGDRGGGGGSGSYGGSYGGGGGQDRYSSGGSGGGGYGRDSYSHHGGGGGGGGHYGGGGGYAAPAPAPAPYAPAPAAHHHHAPYAPPAQAAPQQHGSYSRYEPAAQQRPPAPLQPPQPYGGSGAGCRGQGQQQPLYRR